MIKLEIDEYCGGFLEQHQKIRRYNGGVLYI